MFVPNLILLLPPIAADAKCASSTLEPQGAYEEGGTVVVGMSNISDLTSALELSTGKAGGGAAEGGAFDPAVVKLLAMSYVLEQPTADMHGGEVTTSTTNSAVLDAEAAFLRNEKVALHAGLIGHGAIMSSFASLVRLLTQPPSINIGPLSLCTNISGAADSSSLPSMPAAASTMTASDDPFRALAQASIRDLLSELLDVGDCQHFVVCFEILRRCALLDGISESGKSKTVTSTSTSTTTTANTPSSDSSPTITHPSHAPNQTDGSRAGFSLEPTPTSQLLSDLRVREAYLSYIDILSRLGLFNATNDLIVASKDPYISDLSKKGVRLKVGCGNCGKEIAADQASVNTAGMSVISALWCPRCLRCSDSCAVCMKPVMGLFRWCPICSHGGHAECIDEWFRRGSCNDPTSTYSTTSNVTNTTTTSVRNASVIGRRLRKKRGYECGPLGLSKVSVHSFCAAGCGHKCLAMDEHPSA